MNTWFDAADCDFMGEQVFFVMTALDFRTNVYSTIDPCVHVAPSTILYEHLVHGMGTEE